VKQERICVIVLASSELEKTLQCLASLAKVPNVKCSKIVVKDGTNSTTSIRSAYPDSPIFETEEPHYNEGIQWALGKPFQWICLLSGSAVVEPNFLHEFIAEARSSPEAKIFGAKILQVEHPERILHLGGAWNPTTARYESMGTNQRDAHCVTSALVETVSGEALFMHRSVPETIGLLDPRFCKFWGDIDFCFRARRKGFLVKTAPNAKVWLKTPPADISPQDHYFWCHGRLLWLERNLPPLERHKILKRIIYPDIRKAIGRCFWQTLFSRCPKRRQKIPYARAMIKAYLHFCLGMFGKKKTFKLYL
jgi:GT2 family glycosyltransferase